MSNVSLKLVYKYGNRSLELEISGEKEVVEDFLNKILDRFEVLQQVSSPKEPVESKRETKKAEEVSFDDLPNIKISSSDSLTDILNKMFYSGWGRTPRSLREVMDTLTTFGLYYPKSTIAVTLKRMVEKGVLRRIKGKDGVFKYVTSTPVMGEK